MTLQEQNKAVVRRFNKEVFEEGNETSFKDLIHDDFINRTAPPSISNGPEGMWNMFANILRPAFSDLKIEFFEQIAEGDKVSSRKAITGTHTGVFFGIAPTGRKIRIDVIDIVRVVDGKYKEHWGVNTMERVIAELKSVS